MQVMLWLLHDHHVLPGRYMALPEGEKELLRVMFSYIMRQRSKE